MGRVLCTPVQYNNCALIDAYQHATIVCILYLTPHSVAPFVNHLHEGESLSGSVVKTNIAWLRVVK